MPLFPDFVSALELARRQTAAAVTVRPVAAAIKVACRGQLAALKKEERHERSDSERHQGSEGPPAPVWRAHCHSLHAVARNLSTSARAAESHPTIVLVHGAFASPAGWGGVADALHKDGYQTATPTLALDSVADDVAIVRSTLDSIPGDKILVGHSYGGFVITNAASGRTDVRGLVYTAAYVPDSGETINSLSVGYTPGTFLAHLVLAPSFPFVIDDPQFFPRTSPRT